MSFRSKRVRPGICLIGSIVVGGTAIAEPDLYFRGALSLAGVQDDNLFYTSQSTQSDVITRFTPEVEAGSRSGRISLSGKYSLDAERFADHPELDTNQARQFAALDLETRLSRPASFSLHGDYLSTLSPGELNVATGLPAGRARARRLAMKPSVNWKFSPATAGTFACTLTKDDLAGGVAADTRAAALDLERRVSRRDTLSAGYNFSRYGFEGEPAFTAHTVSFGWDRRVGSRSGITLRAGPRYSEGRFDPEASLALQYAAKRAQASLTLGRTLTTVIGQAGTVVSDSALAGFSYRLLPSLRMGATPGFYRIQDPLGGPETRVYLAGMEANWRISDWVSVVSTWHRNLKRGGPGAEAPVAGGAAQEIIRNTFYLGLIAGRKEPRAPAGGERPAGGTP